MNTMQTIRAHQWWYCPMDDCAYEVITPTSQGDGFMLAWRDGMRLSVYRPDLKGYTLVYDPWESA